MHDLPAVKEKIQDGTHRALSFLKLNIDVAIKQEVCLIDRVVIRNDWCQLCSQTEQQIINSEDYRTYCNIGRATFCQIV